MRYVGLRHPGTARQTVQTVSAPLTSGNPRFQAAEDLSTTQQLWEESSIRSRRERASNRDSAIGTLSSAENSQPQSTKGTCYILINFKLFCLLSVSTFLVISVHSSGPSGWDLYSRVLDSDLNHVVSDGNSDKLLPSVNYQDRINLCSLLNLLRGTTVQIKAVT